MTWSKDEQVAWRKRVVAMPRSVAAGMVKAHHDDPVHGCKCGQEHDWAQMVEHMHRFDAAQRARGLE